MGWEEGYSKKVIKVVECSLGYKEGWAANTTNKNSENFKSGTAV